MSDESDKRRSSAGVPKPIAEMSPQELQDALADEGYSANGRKGWLKEALTDLEREHSTTPSADKAEVIERIKKILDRRYPGKPMSDEVL